MLMPAARNMSTLSVFCQALFHGNKPGLRALREFTAASVTKNYGW